MGFESKSAKYTECLLPHLFCKEEIWKIGKFASNMISIEKLTVVFLLYFSPMYCNDIENVHRSPKLVAIS